MPLQIGCTSSPQQVIRIVSHAPSFLTLLVTFLVGAATTLAVQWVVQIYIVPRVETRKRREERWERDVRELGELMTARLPDLAVEAQAAQGIFGHLAELEAEPGQNLSAIAASRAIQVSKTRAATSAFTDLADTRISWLADRIEALEPEAYEIVKFRDTHCQRQLKSDQLAATEY